jgi:hypothetical protein
MAFPTFEFNWEQLFTWAFWKRWLIEFIGCSLFGITVAYLTNTDGGKAWAWGLSFLIWSLVTKATILSTVTFANILSKDVDFIQGVLHLVAQGLAVNLTTCDSFASTFGVAKASGHGGLAFLNLLQTPALLEFLTVFLYFFLTKKGQKDLPAWLFTALTVAAAFFLNSNACFTPSRIWGGGVSKSWSIIFGTYINNFLAVYFGTNVADYIFD